MATPDSYVVGARVVLHGLVKAPDLNGKSGVVKAELANGRQQVLVDNMDKAVALKVSNIKYEGRSLESLSVKELKKILESKSSITEVAMTGLDKSELTSKVGALKGCSPERIAQWLAEAKPQSAQSTPQVPTPATGINPAQAADQLANMNPEQLRQQARMMRSMPPDQIRRMNPQLANMTDAQILQAASQMEMMASNPAMMKMATDQIKNMSPDQLQQMQEQTAAGTPPAPAAAPQVPAGYGVRPQPQANQAAQAADMMANMTPEQFKQQADMFETMDPDTIRSMNPQLANMSNEQIKMAASQFRMMADNPEMMNMAMNQMKSLSPEQIEAIRNGDTSGIDPAQGMGGDPGQMLANMDKTQLKGMLKSMKENPEMLKQFAATSGIGEEQLAKGLEMFSEMDDAKLDMTLNVMQKAQKAKDVWTQADAKTGGHLIKIVALMAATFFGLIVYWVFFRTAAAAGAPIPAATTPLDIPDMGAQEAVAEDEFGSEF
eukprot:Nitzschia sp. Nitz4//scaffold121_size67750//34985//36457//NITZ4_006068-RA/size67750-processed-gene-0.18-mRNA-1//-1//CDS//3329534351//6093//frame0